MRGTPLPGIANALVSGVIPAYAGNTRLRLRCGASPWDHPRVCGEHQGFLDLLNEGRGSSPRMRGTPVASFATIAVTGIIPAYAGNTSQCAALRAVLRDHPRVCGEHMSATSLAVRLTGSSPRMRGTPVDGSWHALLSGIIPAYAGNTRSECARFHFRRDHPRVCGEHFRTPIRGRATRGSSPRMRGTLPSTIRSAETRGIIPAYAGNTMAVMFSRIDVRDHPRVCGEHRGST